MSEIGNIKHVLKQIPFTPIKIPFLFMFYYRTKEAFEKLFTLIGKEFK